MNIIDANDIGELPFANASFNKPTIINVKKNNEFRKHQKGKRSIVWTYFTALDDKKAMCCVSDYINIFIAIKLYAFFLIMHISL